MSFSAEWLALREPVDHRSRNTDVAAALRGHFRHRTSVRVLDLGSGTGSNLRASVDMLPADQAWTLIDYDPALLAAARRTLKAAGGEDTTDGGVTVLTAQNAATIELRQFDLSGGIRPLLEELQPDLVTASAFFDLVSAAWMEQMVRDLAQTRTAFFTVLTYDGDMRFSPPHPLDDAITAAFNADQRSDKGFGPAAGPAATEALAAAFAASGVSVTTGSSPWQMGGGDHALCDPLLVGIAAAAGKNGAVSAQDCAAWLSFRREALTQPQSHVTIGHSDLFAG